MGLCFTKFCKLLGLKTVITTDVILDAFALVEARKPSTKKIVVKYE